MAIKKNLLPGDLVAFDHENKNCTCRIIDTTVHSKRRSSFILSDSEMDRLDEIARARQIIMSHAVYVVLSATASKSMLYHPGGAIVLADNKFLRRI